MSARVLIILSALTAVLSPSTVFAASEDKQWHREVAFILEKSGDSSPEPDEEYLPSAQSSDSSEEDEKARPEQKPRRVASPKVCAQCLSKHQRGSCPVKRFAHKPMRALYGQHLRRASLKRRALKSLPAQPALSRPLSAPSSLQRAAPQPDAARPEALIATLKAWNLPEETFAEIADLIRVGGTAHHIDDTLAQQLGALLGPLGYEFGFAYDHPGGHYPKGSVYLNPPSASCP